MLRGSLSGGELGTMKSAGPWAESSTLKSRVEVMARYMYQNK